MTKIDTLDGDNLYDSVKMFKALGDETRMRMLNLMRHGELCVCDIMEVLQLPQSTISRHLAHLRNTGWVSARRRGKWIYYRLKVESGTERICSDVIIYLSSLPLLQEDYRAMALHLERKDKEACK